MPTPDSEPVPVYAACEGLVDDAVVRRLLREVGGSAHAVFGRNGKADLRLRIGGFNQAARHFPWVVLVDLNDEAPCPPPLVETWVEHPSEHLCFRVAVHEIEAWLLADPERFARFLSVARSRFPANPESIADPKAMLVSLAQNSRKRAIREDMVPRPGSGRSIGPAYTSRVIEFVEHEEFGWRPAIGAENSDSLARALGRLSELVETWRERLFDS